MSTHEPQDRIDRLRRSVESGQYEVDALAVADAILRVHGVEPTPPSLAPVNRTLARVTDVARGFLMGSADVVPGVSGGTVALVLGIYPRLVSNIRLGSHALGRLLRGDGSGFVSRFKSVEWPFLLSVLAGIALAIVTLASVIGALRDDYPLETAGLFFGLVAASIYVAWRLIDRPGVREAAAVVVAAVVVFLVLGIQSGPITEPSLLVVFAAGAVAICAMILPGVSGAFILLAIGMYDDVIDAIRDRELAVIVVFGVGAVVGLALFSSILHWLLELHHDIVMAGLVGLMVGSLRVLWPWPDGTESATLAAPTDPILTPIVLGIVGVGAVLMLARVAKSR
ncbi:MAG: DUF368 domain-containing protein [Acidimicrobiia bacterium]|nr:DUF368 domain-containing protein [Acidimicrobiia bacterium]